MAKKASEEVAKMLGTVRSRLAANKYDTDETASHIEFPDLVGGAETQEPRQASKPQVELARVLKRVCPAGVYQQRADGTLAADYPACFECGSCRALVPADDLIWSYPAHGAGIQFRQG